MKHTFRPASQVIRLDARCGSRPRRAGLALGAVMLIVGLAAVACTSPKRGFVPSRGGARVGPADPGATAALRAGAAYGRLPLSFEANQGQTGERVRFLARGGGYALFLTPTGAVLSLRNRQPALGGPVSVRMDFVGGSSTPEMGGLDRLPGKAHYLTGNDPRRWRTDIPTYGSVMVRGVYPGVDLVYYGSHGRLEYDIVVAPGADPGSITLGFDGAERLEVDAQGDLVLHLADRQLRWRKPAVYQERDGAREDVPGGYVVRGERQVGFEIAGYDRARPLVIDPVLVYSTFLGGGGDDLAGDIAVDATGSAYVVGRTESANFPIVGGVDPSLGGTQDAFVAKLNPAGSALLYSTYLGGDDEDLANSVAVDNTGTAWVAGATFSRDFPTTAGAFDTTFNLIADGFVAKLDPAGSALLYSTYLGGSDLDTNHDIYVDTAGSAYLVGRTRSADFPAGAFDTSLGGAEDGFVTKLDAAGAALVYSTYLGGGALDETNGITVDAAGVAHVVGKTTSADFPTTVGAFDTTFDGTGDAVVVKLDAAGTALLYSTYLGGAGNEIGIGIAIDPAGHDYVTGHTFANGFPTTPGAFDTSYNGGPLDVFVSRLDPSQPAASQLVFSTYLGGTGSDFGFGIGLDADGNVHVAGETRSADFPTTPGAIQGTAPGGFSDGFVARLNAAGSTLLDSTYLGGGAADACFGLALDLEGSTYVTGDTASADFPTTPGAFDTSFNHGLAGGFDVFATKISFGLTLDHFKCYHVRPEEKFAPLEVTLTDQFEDEVVTVVKPLSLCTPVVKCVGADCSEVGDPGAHLTCYRTKGRRGAPKFQKRTVVVTNQFGQQRLDVLRRENTLCVPSLKSVVPNP